MSVIQSSIDLSSANLTSEYATTNDSEKNISLAKELGTNGIDNNAVTQQNITDEVAIDKVVKQPLTPVQLEKVAQQLQDFVGEMNRGLEFSVDKDSGRDVIKVIDKTSGDLVKQYPSEEVLTLVSKLSDMVGGFIDAKV